MKQLKLLINLVSITTLLIFTSCSKSPEKAIEKMKEITDDFMIEGVKPTEDMVVSKCSDLFIDNYKDNTEWKSKLGVFGKEVQKHIDEKELFDKSKKFPETSIDGSNFETITKEKEYYYLNTTLTITNLKYQSSDDPLKRHLFTSPLGVEFDDMITKTSEFETSVNTGDYVLTDIMRNKMDGVTDIDKVTIKGVVKKMNWRERGNLYSVFLTNSSFVSK